LTFLNLTSVFEDLKAGLSPRAIARKYGKRQSAISYYTKKLESAGLIKKVGYGTWEITSSKSTDVASSNIPPLIQKEVRGHAFVFRLKLPPIPNWKDRAAFLDQKGIKYLPLAGKRTQRITLGDTKIWLSDRTITFYFRDSFFAETSKDAQSRAIFTFKKKAEAVQRLLEVPTFEINLQLIFKVSRQHYALIKNALAQQYDDEGRKLMVSNANGLWLVIDNSYNLHETETLHPVSALTDNQKVQNFFNSLKENPITSTEINGQLAVLIGALKTLTAEVQKIKEKE
jgi:DNA-binding transcriptional ArsR family regulator